ncbi:hypothetical protein FANTH_5282 [Fusarium anthophilum]|uniref:Uncharacterized protein n=1 Tax=Fusarium anthophilum TaxID=48485 RepID=A0A8H4ZMI0_9HYPO|nr:hypothetical protein FANTH_5282 [Fusarium anthophilum]
MDPFGRLPEEVREMIISNLYVEHDFWFLYRASPVFLRQLQTSKLLRAWDTLRKELGSETLRRVLFLVRYPKIGDPIPQDEGRDVYGMPNLYFKDPLLSPQQHLIFEMYDRYQGMLNCFALGPALVPLYRDKYPDAHRGYFSKYLVECFGEHGEHIPNTMPPTKSWKRSAIFLLLLAIEAMDQCPTAFVTSLREPLKELSIKEERYVKFVNCCLSECPYQAFGEESEEEEEDDGDDCGDNGEEEQREAEEMVFIQC